MNSLQASAANFNLHQKLQHSTNKLTVATTKGCSFQTNDLVLRCSLWESRKDVILVRVCRKRSLLVVKANRFGFNGGSGGGWDHKSNSRVVGNLVLGIGLAYLAITGQLGWVLDAIVSLWLIAVLLPIVGLGAFFWFAQRDIVQSNCPNCGNQFQIFKSAMKDGVQLCPYCTQPFSVQGNEFIRESVKFSSNRSSSYGQVFNGFSPKADKGNDSSSTIVDIEAEVKDVE